jgi:hypothetical protein
LLARRRQLLLTAATKKSKSFKLFETVKAVHTKSCCSAPMPLRAANFCRIGERERRGSVSFSVFHLSVFLSLYLFFLFLSFFLSLYQQQRQQVERIFPYNEAAGSMMCNLTRTCIYYSSNKLSLSLRFSLCHDFTQR